MTTFPLEIEEVPDKITTEPLISLNKEEIVVSPPTRDRLPLLSPNPADSDIDPAPAESCIDPFSCPALAPTDNRIDPDIPERASPVDSTNDPLDNNPSGDCKNTEPEEPRTDDPPDRKSDPAWLEELPPEIETDPAREEK